MFKAARVQEHLGVGVWGHIYPGWQKGRYVKFSLLCFYPDGGHYLALKAHSNTLNMLRGRKYSSNCVSRREIL